MPKSTLAGHPLHAMLIGAPAALIPFGFILDAIHRATDDDEYANAAFHSLTGGLAAGVAGAMDYLEIDSGTEVEQKGNVHAMLNGDERVVQALHDVGHHVPATGPTLR
jgi:uncharacterized membrane protein